jgi:hypothetical protein
VDFIKISKALEVTKYWMGKWAIFVSVLISIPAKSGWAIAHPAYQLPDISI